ncbi:hypothetical protein H6P81_010177 [Aristolochia fimbriata]|uniref:Transmembrane protein n=1 Tax=Aristolochia fimbriata TaxID=158543 RepID=A0AAV7ERD7_ARIFI|nr:hypothetical protein H6P81_010177 [Aristolochia fimbriata]
MATSSRSRSSGPVLPLNGIRRSSSPSGRFCTSSYSQSASAFASSSASFSATFSSPSSGFLHRSASPTRVNLCGPIPTAPSVRFCIDRSPSPGRSFAVSPRERQVVKHQTKPLSAPQKRTSKEESGVPASAESALGDVQGRRLKVSGILCSVIRSSRSVYRYVSRSVVPWGVRPLRWLCGAFVFFVVWYVFVSRQGLLSFVEATKEEMRVFHDIGLELPSLLLELGTGKWHLNNLYLEIGEEGLEP